MKIYLFDPETGIFQGEDFTDDAPMRPGRSAVPPHATTIAPPPTANREEVPFFSAARKNWELRLWERRPVSFAAAGEEGTAAAGRPAVETPNDRQTARQGEGL